MTSAVFPLFLFADSLLYNPREHRPGQGMWRVASFAGGGPKQIPELLNCCALQHEALYAFSHEASEISRALPGFGCRELPGFGCRELTGFGCRELPGSTRSVGV